MILIVDDDEFIARFLERILESTHETDVAFDVETALREVARLRPELALLDISLGRDSGLDLLKAVRAESPDTAVVMVTGEDSPMIAADALERGAYGYVLKPFVANEILIAVDNALRRRQLEIDNRSMLLQLRELNETKDALIAAVSHDLRSPLTAIVGLAELMDERLSEFSTDEIQGFLGDISRSAQRMTDMLQGLLDRDRVSRGVVVTSATDVRELLERVSAGIDADDHKLVVECDGVIAVVDGVMIERVVDNLVRNAVKHTPSGTTIWMRVHQDGSGTEIIVEDNGPGIDDALKPTIFDAFRRGATEASGSGVGLSLVHRFTALHGGTVVLSDRDGGGASFAVRLPDMPVSA